MKNSQPLKNEHRILAYKTTYNRSFSDSLPFLSCMCLSCLFAPLTYSCFLLLYGFDVLFLNYSAVVWSEVKILQRSTFTSLDLKWQKAACCFLALPFVLVKRIEVYWITILAFLCTQSVTEGMHSIKDCENIRESLKSKPFAVDMSGTAQCKQFK